VFYKVDIQGMNTQTPVLGELQFYCFSPTESVLKDDTVVYMVVKVYASPHSMVLLESLYLIPLPGNPNDNSYEDNLPDISHLFVFALGLITCTAESTASSTLKMFHMNVSDYI